MGWYTLHLELVRDDELLLARTISTGKPLTVGPAGDATVPTDAFDKNIKFLTPTKCGYWVNLPAGTAGKLRVGPRELRIEGGLLHDPRPEPLLLTAGDHGTVQLPDGLSFNFSIHKPARGLPVRPQIDGRFAAALAIACGLTAAFAVVVAHAPKSPETEPPVQLVVRKAILDQLMRPPPPKPKPKPPKESELAKKLPEKAAAKAKAKPKPELPKPALAENPKPLEAPPLKEPTPEDRAREEKRKELAQVLSLAGNAPPSRALTSLDATLSTIGSSAAIASNSRFTTSSSATTTDVGRFDLAAARLLSDANLALPAKDKGESPGKGKAKLNAPTKEQIHDAVAARQGEVQLCYERELLVADDAKQGRMIVRWRIDAAGAVTDISIESDNIGSKRLRQCVTNQIKKWRFPSCGDGRCVVVYPFEFYTRK